MNFNNIPYAKASSGRCPQPSQTARRDTRLMFNGVRQQMPQSSQPLQNKAPIQHVEPQIQLQQQREPQVMAQQMRPQSRRQALPPQVLLQMARQRFLPDATRTRHPAPRQTMREPALYRSDSVEEQLLAEAESLLTIYSLQNSPGWIAIRQFLAQCGWNFAQVQRRLGIVNNSHTQHWKMQSPHFNGRPPAAAPAVEVPPQTDITIREMCTDSKHWSTVTINGISGQQNGNTSGSTQGGESVFMCPLCAIVASDKESIVAHLARMHGINSTSG